MRIGIDAGGTFTDFIVLTDKGAIETFKLRSNPKSPATVILEGLLRAAQHAEKVEVVHGSTVATNALLERKGVRTAFVTTAGFEDLIHIGRQNRERLYDLTPPPRVPLVDRDRCFGINERTYYDGTVAVKPEPAEVTRLAGKLHRAGVQSVAICCLHSYQNASNEREIAHILEQAFPEGFYICRSEEVSPEFREFERASTTVINAYVGPLMDRYLGQLEYAEHRQGWLRSLSIMQSNGGYMSAAQARRHAVRTVLSGPAGGVIGAVELARRSGYRQVLGFDMGGTSTDVSLCDKQPRVTVDAAVDGFPVRVPMLDIHTVGAGGGSVARVDEGGLLRVGPESAGADPGPACYGTGELPTVTDAHVVLGRIAADQFLGGGMHIDTARSRAAVDSAGSRLGLDTVAAAAGIIKVANANMERAIRAVSIERGYDPRQFALVAFGGGGGLHACELAGQLGMRTVIVPRYAEALSALGMLLADGVRDYSAGVLGRADIDARFKALEEQAREESGAAAKLERLADLRYKGQSYELSVPWRTQGTAEKGFHAEHRRMYGYASPEREVEVVTVRVRATVSTVKPKIRPLAKLTATTKLRRIYADGKWQRLPLYQREQLVGLRKRGPALVIDYGATTLVPTGWVMSVDKVGNLICEVQSARGSSSTGSGTSSKRR